MFKRASLTVPKGVPIVLKTHLIPAHFPTLSERSVGPIRRRMREGRCRAGRTRGRPWRAKPRMLPNLVVDARAVEGADVRALDPHRPSLCITVLERKHQRPGFGL